MAKNRHDRMGDRTDPNTCEHDRQEFPAIGELERDDIALANAEGIQPERDAVGSGCKLGVGEPPSLIPRWISELMAPQ